MPNGESASITALTTAGVDAMVPYYDLAQKRSNIDGLQGGFRFVEADLRTHDLDALLSDVDVVFHQAGQPGVRASWEEFGSYLEHNVAATQRLLEAVRRWSVSRLVFASSSSIYGDALSYPTDEHALPRPKSPYGVTKLAAEHLCGVYARNFGLPVVALRYFTVYGPRPRPDLAMHRLSECALRGALFPLYGTGDQIRDFTHVDDVVQANLLAASVSVPAGSAFNIAGGDAVSLRHVIELVEGLTGARVRLYQRHAPAGDVERTGGAVEAARQALGWVPRLSVEEGLKSQVDWHLDRCRGISMLATTQATHRGPDGRRALTGSGGYAPS